MQRLVRDASDSLRMSGQDNRSARVLERRRSAAAWSLSGRHGAGSLIRVGPTALTRPLHSFDLRRRRCRTSGCWIGERSISPALRNRSGPGPRPRVVKGNTQYDLRPPVNLGRPQLLVLVAACWKALGPALSAPADTRHPEFVLVRAPARQPARSKSHVRNQHPAPALDDHLATPTPSTTSAEAPGPSAFRSGLCALPNRRLHPTG